MKIEDLVKSKGQKKIAMLSLYDFQMAQIASRAGVDCLLVGDSLGMVVYGDDDTRAVEISEMIRHGAAVVKGCGEDGPPVIVDMPFGSYDWAEMAVDNARRVVTETGCDAVKIEGAAEIVKAVVEAGIKVVAHTGLKPQTAERFCVQGRDEDQRKALLAEAAELEAAGAIALVLECVPVSLAVEMTEMLKIPTIGIGAGKECDGQVLVADDVLGITQRRLPRFVRKYFDGGEAVAEAFREFQKDVEKGNFPSDDESYL